MFCRLKSGDLVTVTMLKASIYKAVSREVLSRGLVSKTCVVLPTRTQLTNSLRVSVLELIRRNLKQSLKDDLFNDHHHFIFLFSKKEKGECNDYFQTKKKFFFLFTKCRFSAFLIKQKITVKMLNVSLSVFVIRHII